MPAAMARRAEMALRSQRPRVLLAAAPLYHSSGNTSAHYSSATLALGPKGEQQASSTGDCNYTSVRANDRRSAALARSQRIV